MQNSFPTIAEMNATQAAWMALSSNDPDPVKEKVFSLMKKQPKRHLVIVGDDFTLANIHDGGPAWAAPIPIEKAIACASSWGIPTSFAWSTAGKYVSLV